MSFSVNLQNGVEKIRPRSAVPAKIKVCEISTIMRKYDGIRYIGIFVFLRNNCAVEFRMHLITTFKN